jgi:ribosomal protein S18 acetylase RimI-like enzyme
VTVVIEEPAAVLAEMSETVERALPDEEDRAALLASILVPVAGKSAVRLAARDERGRVVGLLIAGLVEDGTPQTLAIELLAVEPDAQGRGVGRALLAEAEVAARRLGAERMTAGGSAHRYLWPGVASRRTAALGLLLRHGFRRTGIAFNMTADLAALPPVPAPGPGIALVAFGADPGVDADAVAAAATFSSGWATEVGLAVSQPSSGGFAAVRDGRVLGFVGHGVYRPASFGPLGTVAEARGAGVGGLLTLASLAAMRDAGIRTGQIGWIAEDALPFYARVSGAVVGDAFWQLSRALD